MKKVLLVVCVVLMLSMAACSSGGNDIVGTWGLDSQYGEIMEAMDMDLGMDLAYTFDADGKVTLTVNMDGTDASVEGTYTMDGDTVTLTGDEVTGGEATMELQMKGNKLYRDGTAYLEKQ